MILRLSKSTIEDLSFYIGFTRIGSRIKDLGPCFGMNGHSRRAMDVILGLSKSTTEDLPVFIGFGSLSRVKMVVLDEHIAFVRIFTEKMNLFMKN